MVTVAGLTLYVCFRHPCHQTLSVFSEFDFKYISSFISTKIIKTLIKIITILVPITGAITYGGVHAAAAYPN